jgi:hypothetical protein
MPSIFVPPRMAAALALQNLVNAILQHIAYEPDPAAPGATRDRLEPLTTAQLKDAFERLDVPGGVRNTVMARLLREKLVRTDGARVWVGDLADLRAYLAKREGTKHALVGGLS